MYNHQSAFDMMPDSHGDGQFANDVREHRDTRDRRNGNPRHHDSRYVREADPRYRDPRDKVDTDHHYRDYQDQYDTDPRNAGPQNGRYQESYNRRDVQTRQTEPQYVRHQGIEDDTDTRVRREKHMERRDERVRGERDHSGQHGQRDINSGRATDRIQSNHVEPGGQERSRTSSVREVSDHLEELNFMEYGPRDPKLPGGKKFFKKVQHELEEQRQEWKDEIQKLTDSSLPTKLPQNAQAQGTNSYIDTSSGHPIFTAFVDVSEFHAKSVQVDYDSLSNKVVIRGQTINGIGTMTKTFTQRVQLPRYADDQRLSTKLSRNGILKVEVPLLYYFPQQQNKGRNVKSFVNEVKTSTDGSQILEILVNTGPGVRARDLHIEVTDDRVLLVSADKDDTEGKTARKLIKKYHLTERANVDKIRSKMGKDGRLIIYVPLFRDQPRPR